MLYKQGIAKKSLEYLKYLEYLKLGDVRYEFITELKWCEMQDSEAILKEANELLAIFTSIIKNLKL